jgi:hypothetical protein
MKNLLDFVVKTRKLSTILYNKICQPRYKLYSIVEAKTLEKCIIYYFDSQSQELLSLSLLAIVTEEYNIIKKFSSEDSAILGFKYGKLSTQRC